MLFAFSLTKEDQVLSVPIILDALKDIRKPLFLAGDMNSIKVLLLKMPCKRSLCH